MSVEVGIINKNAVCLSSNNKNILQYSLSENTPVGVMIYGNPYIMGIHWEPIIREFKDSIGDDVFDTAVEYSNRFLEFLKMNVNLFSEESQHIYFFEKYLRFIKNLREIAESDRVKLQRVIEYTYEKMKTKERINLFEVLNNKDEKTGEEVYSKLLNDAIDEVFPEYDLGQYYRGMLFNLGRYMFSKGSFDNQSSGVVIAGFGAKEYYPSMVTYEIDCVIDNILIYRNALAITCGALNDGNIYHFAINNIIKLSEEIDHSFVIYLKSYFSKLFNSYNDHIINTIGGISDYDKVNMRNIKNSIIENMEIDLQEFIEENYVNKMLASINLMSTEEMILIAKSMIYKIDFKVREHQDDILLTKRIQTITLSKMEGYTRYTK